MLHMHRMLENSVSGARQYGSLFLTFTVRWGHAAF